MREIIAGVDEVGRGSLVGPVYAAAVILNKEIIDYNATSKYAGTGNYFLTESSPKCQKHIKESFNSTN